MRIEKKDQNVRFKPDLNILTLIQNTDCKLQKAIVNSLQFI